MRRKTCRRLSFVGLACSAIIAGLFVLSARGQCGYTAQTFTVGIPLGHFGIVLRDDSPDSEWWCSDGSHSPVTNWWPVWIGNGILVPLWMPFLVFAAPPIIGWWRTRKLPSGHCPVCGYDLTGNVSGVCPECGEDIKTSRHG